MGYSTKIIQNAARNNGDSAIALRVIINRKKKQIPLKISWPAQYFSKDAEVCLPRWANDEDAADHNLTIGDAKAHANEIFKYLRLSGETVTMEKFVRRWGRNISRENFVNYFEKRAKERRIDREITDSTYRAHLKTLVKLRAFKKEIQFADLDERWGFDFDAFLKRHIKSRIGDTNNTRWAHHKTVKTYLGEARKRDRIHFNNPYDFFSISMVDGTWRPIYEKDINKLWDFFVSKDSKERLRKAVARLLFSTWTGLRASDLDRVTSEWNYDGVLKFTAHKTKKDNIYVQVPMIEPAQQIFEWASEMVFPGRPIFRWFTDQECNRQLKKVGEVCGIRHNLHHHVGRHTFITQLLKHGAGLEMAQDFAGHRDIKTTKKYDHPDDEKRLARINVLNKTLRSGQK